MCFSIKNLFSGYNSKRVLKNISIEIPENSLISLIGPNGSGKSTFLRVLSGLQKYSGSVKLEEIEIKNISRKKLSQKISIMLPGKFFNPSYPFSVKEIISMGRLPFKKFLSYRKNISDEEIILNSAKKVNIENLLSRNIMTLSEGERQLVMLSCVLAQDTKIILLDEPTSALDPDRTAKVFSILREIVHNKNNKTVIAAVHDINSSIAFSDYYIAIKDGFLISHGKADELDENILKNLYDSEFSAYFSKKGDAIMWRAVPN